MNEREGKREREKEGYWDAERKISQWNNITLLLASPASFSPCSHTYYNSNFKDSSPFAFFFIFIYMAISSLLWKHTPRVTQSLFAFDVVRVNCKLQDAL